MAAADDRPAEPDPSLTLRRPGSPEVVLQLAHRSRLSVAAYSSDGRRVITAGSDGLVKLWDAETGMLLRTFRGHEPGLGAFADRRKVFSVDFGLNGRRIVSGGTDGMIRIWNVKTGKLLRTIPAHAGHVYCVRHRPGGREVASAGKDSFVRLWHVGTGRLLRTFDHGWGSVLAIDFSPNGRWIASSGRNGLVKIWSVRRGRLVRTIQAYAPGRPRSVSSVCFSPDGSQLLTGGSDGTMRLWDAGTGRQLRLFAPEHDNDEPVGSGTRVRSVCFSPDARHVAVGGRRSIRLWHVRTGKLLRSFENLPGGGASVAFNAVGTELVTTRRAGIPVFYDLKTGDPRSAPAAQPHPVPSMCVHPDGEEIYVHIPHRNGRRWSLTTGKAMPTFAEDPHKGWELAEYSPDGRRFMWHRWGHPRFHDTETGELLHAIEEWRPGGVTASCFGPEGRTAYGADQLGNLYTWSVAEGERLWTKQVHDGEIRSLAVSPDGRKLAAGCKDGTIELVDTGRGEVTGSLDAHDRAWVRCVQFSPDGRRLVSGGDDGRIYVWDAEDGRRVRSLYHHIGGVSCLRFDVHGRRLLSCGADGKVRLWDVARGKLQRIFAGHNAGVHTADFAGSDGRRMVSCDYAGRVLLWDLASGQCLARMVSFEHDGELHWVCVTHEGYLNCSDGAEAFIGVRKPGTNEVEPMVRRHAHLRDPEAVTRCLAPPRRRP